MSDEKAISHEAERIEALEKRVAVLEALAQAQQSVSISAGAADAVIQEVNRRMREGGNPILLC